VLVLAQEDARLLNHSFIGTEHILLGLVHEGEGVAARVLRSFDISLEAVREKVEETTGTSVSAPTGSPPFTPRAKKVLELSLREALQLGHNYIGTEHLLLGTLREGEGAAVEVLVSLGADPSRIRQRVMQLLGVEHSGADIAISGLSYGPRRHVASSWVGRGEPGAPAARVGRQWTAQVVRTGRRREDCARAYDELADLVQALGFSLEVSDASEITLTSVETADGPGIMLSVEHWIVDDPLENDLRQPEPTEPGDPSIDPDL
jgi:hypothetical protein